MLSGATEAKCAEAACSSGSGDRLRKSMVHCTHPRRHKQEKRAMKGLNRVAVHRAVHLPGSSTDTGGAAAQGWGQGRVVSGADGSVQPLSADVSAPRWRWVWGTCSRKRSASPVTLHVSCARVGRCRGSSHACACDTWQQGFQINLASLLLTAAACRAAAGAVAFDSKRGAVSTHTPGHRQLYWGTGGAAGL